MAWGHIWNIFVTDLLRQRLAFLPNFCTYGLANGSNRMQSSTRQQLEEMEQMGGTAFVDEVIELFFSECEMRFMKLETALAEGDLPEVGRLFHMIKGSAASTGTMRLHRITTIGELAGEQGEAALALRCCQLGIRELNLLKTTFKNWKQKTSHENTAG